MSDEADTVLAKLVADSGDQVQVPLKETGPHTGVFEGSAETGELPAGAHLGPGQQLPVDEPLEDGRQGRAGGQVAAVRGKVERTFGSGCATVG